MNEPCLVCLNCRNGAPGLCLKRDDWPGGAWDAQNYVPATCAEQRKCECGKPLSGIRRWCAECSKRRRRAQTREAVRRLRTHVSKTASAGLVNIRGN